MKVELASLDDEIDTRIAIRNIAERARHRGDAVLTSILQDAVAEIDTRIAHLERLATAHRGSDRDPCAMETRQLVVNGQRKTLALERGYWIVLEGWAAEAMVTVSALCERAADLHPGAMLASALRVLVLDAAAPLPGKLKF